MKIMSFLGYYSTKKNVFGLSNMFESEEEEVPDVTDSTSQTLQLLDDISFDNIRPQYLHLQSFINTFIILRPRLAILIENETDDERIGKIHMSLKQLFKLKKKICIDQLYRKRKKTPVPPDLRNHMQAKIEDQLQEAITDLYKLVVVEPVIPTE